MESFTSIGSDADLRIEVETVPIFVSLFSVVVVVPGAPPPPRAVNGYDLDEYAPYEFELNLVNSVDSFCKEGERVADGEPFKALLKVRKKRRIQGDGGIGLCCP